MIKISPLFIILLFFLYFPFFGVAQNVTIEWNDVRQTIDGFGASDAWRSDDIMKHPDKDDLLDLLFKTEGGAGLSIIRHRIPPRDEEWIDHGVNLTSGDLDMGSRFMNGLRFVNVTIPNGATITKAYIQFKAKDNASSACNLTIQGQAADNTSTFAAISMDISSRPATTAAVTWAVPAWVDGDRGMAQQTSDIKSIVQEIVDRGGWQSGNDLVIKIKDYTGKRSAVSFDNDTSNAPELVVEYDSGMAFSTKVNNSSDDAEEEGLSIMTYNAQITQEAFNRGCKKVWAAAWSPPYYYKSNNQTNGGTLLPAHYQDFANHLEAYRSTLENLSGINLYGISPQNEPGIKPWESCVWDKNDFRDFIKNNLGPTLASSCKIIVPEETNWNNVANFYGPTFNDPAANTYVDIVAGHVYGGNPDVSYNYFGSPVWETEWSYDTSQDDLSINNGVQWAYNFYRLLVNAEVSACHHWWLVNMNGDGKQQGLITASENISGYTVAKRLWTIGNFSKFVRPGWNRIDATKNPADNVFIAAFKNADTHEFAIVAINNSNNDKSITFDFDGFTSALVTPHRTSGSQDLEAEADIICGDGFSTTLPGKTVTTYVGTAMTVTNTTDKITPKAIQIYPNPSSGTLTLENVEGEIEVSNLLGQIILRKNLEGDIANLDLSELAKGVYFIVIAGTTHKIAIE